MYTLKNNSFDDNNSNAELMKVQIKVNTSKNQILFPK